MTSLGAPDFGDLDTQVFNPMIYPRRVIIEVLRNVFSQAVFAEFPGQSQNPFQFVTEANGAVSKTSRLMIADTFSDELGHTDMRPTILVGRGAFRFGDIAIDGRGFGGALPSLLHAPDGVTPVKHLGSSGSTKQVFQDMSNMAVAINCYARKSQEAESLAWHTAGFIRFYEYEIKQGSRISRLGSAVVGDVVPAKSDSEHDLYLVPITLEVHQSITWVKSNSATVAQILAGLAKPSGNVFPMVYGLSPDTVMTTVLQPIPIMDSPSLLDRWFNLSPSP